MLQQKIFIVYDMQGNIYNMIDLVMVLKEASPDVLYYPSYYLVNNDYYINTGLLSKSVC